MSLEDEPQKRRDLSPDEIEAEFSKLGLDPDDIGAFPLEDSRIEEEVELADQTGVIEPSPFLLSIPEKLKTQPLLEDSDGTKWADDQLRTQPHLFKIKLEVDRQLEQAQDRVFYPMNDDDSAAAISTGIFEHVPLFEDAEEFIVEFQDVELDYLIDDANPGDYRSMFENDDELDAVLFDRPEDLLKLQLPLEDERTEPQGGSMISGELEVLSFHFRI